MNRQEVIEDILSCVINDNRYKWDSHELAADGITQYANQIITLLSAPTIPVSEWISVEDRLPDKVTDVGGLNWVHIYLNDNTPVETARLLWNDTWIDRTGANIFPTHWQPLPQPPNQ